MRLPLLKIGFFLILLTVAIAFWFYFFTFSYPAIGYGDWLKEYQYLNILRFAILNREIPWSFGSHPFLTNPEIIFSLDLMALPWLSNTQYFFIHTTIFYAIGFIGLISLMRDWSYIPIFFVWLLFTFNGFILGHLGAGHFQFIGYFLYPLLFFLVTRLKQDQEHNTYLHSVYIAFLLSLLFLNGSLHPAIWACIFLLLTGIFEPTILGRVAFSIMLAGALSAFKLIPAATYDTRASAFVTGYPSLSTFINAFTVIDHQSALSTNVGLLGWFEYDAYIGFIGAVLLLFFTLKSFASSKTLFIKGMLFAGLLMVILSLGNVYEIVTWLPKPYFQVERIVTRFISLPLVLFVLCSGYVMDQYWKATAWEIPGKILLAVLMPLMCFEIYSYLQFYRLPLIQSAGYVAPEFIAQSLSTDNSELRYLYYRYACISLIAILFSIGLLIRQYHKIDAQKC